MAMVVRETGDLYDDATGLWCGVIDLNGREQIIAPGYKSITGDYTLSEKDNSIVLYCSIPLTIIVPAGLSPRPSVIIVPPPTGVTSIASSGGALLNGATVTITRDRTSNPAGTAIIAYRDSDGYGVS